MLPLEKLGKLVTIITMLLTDSTVSIYRRLGALGYDSLIILTLCYSASWPLMLLFPQGIAPETLWYQCYLVLVWASYIIISWRFCRQTIGMRAWHIYLKSTEEPLKYTTCVKRLCLAFIGWLTLIEPLSVWLYPQSETMCDRLSRTWLERIK